jgi:hypothetical protein
MIRRVTAGVAAGAALACASVPRAPGGYAFPESFTVTQIVTVDQGRTGSLEFLASLRRVDDDYEVTLFDGALQVPLMTASSRSGAASVQVMAAGLDGAFGLRLLSLLQDLYRRDFPASVEGRTENDAGAFAVRLDGLPRWPSPCRFPSTIEIMPHRAGDPRLLVRTVDVSCGPGRRGLSDPPRTPP